MTTPLTHTISEIASETRGGVKTTRYYSFDRTDTPASHFKLVCYEGTTCENTLAIEVYEMVGQVNADGTRHGYRPLYGFTITPSREECGGFRGTGYRERHEAMLAAMARAVGYGNGGFPLDYAYQWRHAKER